MTADPAGWPDDVREAVARALRKRSTGLEVAKWQSWLPEADAALEATRPFVAASVAAAAEAMREESARLIESRCCGDPGCRVSPVVCSQKAAADAIRALPIPSADALARRDAEMRREGMLKAAWIAENIHPSAASAVGEAHMRSYRDAITYAIRARAGGEEGDAPCMRCGGGECQQCEGNPA